MSDHHEPGTAHNGGVFWKSHKQLVEDNAVLLAALKEASGALAELYDRASSFSVSGVYFDEPCFKENVAALERASNAEDAAHDAIAKAESSPEPVTSLKGDGGG